MRFVTTLMLALVMSAPAAAQTAPACEAKQAALGGIGRASVVAFTGPILGDRVCATVARIAIDGFSAALVSAPSQNALVDASVGSGSGATLVVTPYALSAVPAGTPVADGATTVPVGPFVIAPGGAIPNFNGDVATQPRVVLAFAGQSVLLIGTNAVALVDLARELRDQPDLFGADTIERAVVLDAGTAATLALHTADGTFGADATGGAKLLELGKR